MNRTDTPNRNKSRVLFLITKSNWGGAQKYVYDVAGALESAHWQVTVALGGTGEKGATPGLLNTKLQARGIDTHIVKSFMRNVAPLRDLYAIIEIYRLLVAVKPDIFHLNSPKAAGVGSVAAQVYNLLHRHHVHTVCTVHGWSFKEDRPRLIRALIYLFSWLTTLLVERTIVITKEDERLGKGMWLLKNRIHLIQNGIRPPEFLSREQARTELLQRSNHMESPDYWIGSIAELHPNKGLRYLLEASRAVPASTICILGEGEERAHLEHIPRGLAHTVLLPGFVPEAARYLRAFDVFVLPSLKEGLPTVLLEAGYAGIPVVVSDLESIRDIVPNEQYGVLVPAKNTPALAHALKTARQGSRGEYSGVELHRYVAERFDFERMFSAITALYRVILNTR